MDPVTGLIGGGLLGGIKSIFEAIAHKNAVRKAAKANTFAFGGRQGVDYPGAPPSAFGNILSGAGTGLAMGQAMQTTDLKNNLWKALMSKGEDPGALAQLMDAYGG